MPPRRVLAQRFENTRVRFYGDLAIATGAVVTEYAPATPGEASRQTVSFTDVLTWRDGRWQALSSQETLGAGSAH